MTPAELRSAVFRDVRPELEALGRMQIFDLRTRYVELIGVPPSQWASAADLRAELAILLIQRATARLSKSTHIPQE